MPPLALPKWIVPTLSVALLASACTISKVDPKATVHISGRALAADGTPLADARVQLFKEADLGEAVVGVVLTVGSLGAVCLLPGAPAICRQAETATTDADGNYSFDLKGSDTQGLVGDADTLDVVVTAPHATATAATTALRFTVAQTSVTLPDARLWGAAPRVRSTRSQIAETWPSLTATYGSSQSYSADLYQSSAQAAVWTQAASGGRAAIDARILEDRGGSVAVTGETTLPGTGTGSGVVHASYLSHRTSVRATAGAPPSRHDHCEAVTGTFDLAAVPQRTCAITDGDLTTPAHLTAVGATIVTGAVVDLGRVRPINLIVGRGLSGLVLVEVSTDGKTYRQVGSGTATTLAVSPPGRPRARYVRLRSPSGLDESLMTEISVW